MRGEELRRVRNANLRRLSQRYSLAEIARRSGTNEKYLSQILNEVVQQRGKNPRALSDNYAAKIENGLNLGAGWMDVPHHAVDAQNRINEAQQAIYGNGNTVTRPRGRGHVPLLSWAQAGAWSERADLYAPSDNEDWVACAVSHGPHTFAVRVEGDSMTAPYGISVPAGTIIFVDPDQSDGVASGDLVIAKLHDTNDVTFKRFARDAGRVFLQPLNPQFPPIYEEFQVVGRVIAMFQSFGDGLRPSRDIDSIPRPAGG